MLLCPDKYMCTLNTKAADNVNDECMLREYICYSVWIVELCPIGIIHYHLQSGALPTQRVFQVHVSTLLFENVKAF